MSENILEKIIEKKIIKINNLKKTLALESLKDIIDKNDTFLNFKEKIENNLKAQKFSIIAEIKKASPSAGVILDNYDPVQIANIYDQNKLKKLGMHSLLGVGMGSVRGSYLVTIEWNGLKITLNL